MSQHRNNVIAATLVLVVSSTFAVGPLDEGEKTAIKRAKQRIPRAGTDPRNGNPSSGGNCTSGSMAAFGRSRTSIRRSV